ncbi:MAG: hypothetical protein KA419_15880 [Acidobacteria bacterium]|nr:hypothetical protein [Acidobacteriota bacterium]
MPRFDRENRLNTDGAREREAVLEGTVDLGPLFGKRVVHVVLPLIRVTAGSFTMGSGFPDSFSDEQPLHRVTLSQGFWLGKSSNCRFQPTPSSNLFASAVPGRTRRPGAGLAHLDPLQIHTRPGRDGPWEPQCAPEAAQENCPQDIRLPSRAPSGITAASPAGAPPAGGAPAG